MILVTLSEPGAGSEPEMTDVKFTEQELKLLVLLSEGKGRAVIAEEGGWTPGTVQAYISGMMRYVRGVGYEPGNTIGLVALALRQGWIK